MEGFIAKEAIIAGHILFSQLIYDAYGLAKDVTTHPQVSRAMEQMDLGADLKVIEALVKKIGNQRGYRIPDPDDPMIICLHQVEEMIQKIKTNLEEIDQLIKVHHTKYFASWRATGCDPLLNRLKVHKKTLDNRVNRLIQMMRV